jgi:hypothetical protein
MAKRKNVLGLALFVGAVLSSACGEDSFETPGEPASGGTSGREGTPSDAGDGGTSEATPPSGGGSPLASGGSGGDTGQAGAASTAGGAPFVSAGAAGTAGAPFVSDPECWSAGGARAEAPPAEIGGAVGCSEVACKFSGEVCGRPDPFFECNGCARGSEECACACYALTVKCGNDCEAYSDCISQCFDDHC